MLNKVIDQSVQRVPKLKQVGMSVSWAIHQAVLQGGAPTRMLADILHGVGLGHPLHAVLTDVTVGSWIFGTIFDVIWLRKRNRVSRQAAETLLTLGTLSAIPTALSGLADFTTIPERAAGIGLVHALTNVLNLSLFSVSLALRHNRKREEAAAVSLIALTTMSVAALLGGHMAYSLKVGVNRDAIVDPLPNWTPAADFDSLQELTARRVNVKDHPILLYRKGDSVYAISAVCSHDAGNLAEGHYEGCTVECPLHQSVFDLRDGRVIHGPATAAVTAYRVRIRDGQVEVLLDTAG